MEKLPQDGPTVTYNMIFFLSAFTDIIMAMTISLVSILIALIALMSIKYTLMSTLEEEIGELNKFVMVLNYAAYKKGKR